VTTDLYDASVTSLGGDEADLHAYKSQALLIVNTASKCGLTPQYAGLQRLQRERRDDDRRDDDDDPGGGRPAVLVGGVEQLVDDVRQVRGAETAGGDDEDGVEVLDRREPPRMDPS